MRRRQVPTYGKLGGKRFRVELGKPVYYRLMRMSAPASHPGDVTGPRKTRVSRRVPTKRVSYAKVWNAERAASIKRLSIGLPLELAFLEVLGLSSVFKRTICLGFRPLRGRHRETAGGARSEVAQTSL